MHVTLLLNLLQYNKFILPPEASTGRLYKLEAGIRKQHKGDPNKIV